MNRLNELFVHHAQKMAQQPEGSVLSGVYSDCHGTLFNGDDMNPLLAAFLRAAPSMFKMEPNIISSYMAPYQDKLTAAGLDEICQLHDKTHLNNALMDKDQKLEFLIDDEPMFMMDAVTLIHPRDFIPMLKTMETTLLAQYMRPQGKRASTPASASAHL